jgi:cell wall assembly regulator SMI1
MDLGEALLAWDRALVEDWLERGNHLPEAVASGTTALRAPATEAELRALEDRLSKTLPPSYRQFLLTSNGAWAKPPEWVLGPDAPEGPAVGLHPTSEVGWLRDKVPDAVEAWEHLPELGGMLQVSCQTWGDTLLLDPHDVTVDGEWAAWLVGFQTGETEKHASFHALLEAHLGWIRPGRAGGPDPYAQAMARALDPTAAERSRIESIDQVGSDRGKQRWADDLVRLARGAPETSIRRQALWALKGIDDPRVLPLLEEALVSGDRTLVDAAAYQLGRSRELEAQSVLARGLRIPGVGRVLATEVSSRSADVLWEAWVETGDVFLLGHLARLDDPRAQEPLKAALVDPETGAQERRMLVASAPRSGDPSVVPVIVAACAFAQDEFFAVNAVQSLARLGAKEEARAIRAEVPRDSWFLFHGLDLDD